MKKLTISQYINIGIIVLVLIFIGQNLDIYPVKFLFFTFKLPLIIIILACLLLGYVTALIMRKNGKSTDDEEE